MEPNQTPFFLSASLNKLINIQVFYLFYNLIIIPHQ